MNTNLMMNLPFYESLALGDLNLPNNILHRPFLFSTLPPPSQRHAEALQECRSQLEPVVGKVASRKIINLTIRQHLLFAAPPKPPNGVYCSVPGAASRGIKFCDGRSSNATTDVGYHYQSVSHAYHKTSDLLNLTQCFHPASSRREARFTSHRITDSIPTSSIIASPNLYALMTLREELRPVPRNAVTPADEITSE